MNLPNLGSLKKQKSSVKMSETRNIQSSFLKNLRSSIIKKINQKRQQEVDVLNEHVGNIKDENVRKQV